MWGQWECHRPGILGQQRGVNLGTSDPCRAPIAHWLALRGGLGELLPRVGDTNAIRCRVENQEVLPHWFLVTITTFLGILCRGSLDFSNKGAASLSLIHSLTYGVASRPRADSTIFLRRDYPSYSIPTSRGMIVST